MDEKMMTLLDMQEHPENYPEQTLQDMAEDPEVRELMEATAQLKQAMMWENTHKQATNVDDEWQRFAKNHFAESRSQRGWLKVAAIFIGVLFVSGIAFAAIHLVRQQASQQEKPQAEQTTNPTPHVSIPADTIPTDTIVPKVIRFDEATLEKILTDMSDYYRLRVEWKNDEAKSLRLFFQWDQRLKPTEAMEQLNMFERFHLEMNDSTIIAE